MKQGYGFVRCKKCKESSLVLWLGEAYGQDCPKCGEWMLVTWRRIQRSKEIKPKDAKGAEL